MLAIKFSLVRKGVLLAGLVLTVACRAEPVAAQISPLIPPQLDRLPQPAARPTVDLGAIADGYPAVAIPDPLLPRTRLWILVSLDLPRATLRQLLQQSIQAGVPLTLRGFKAGSLRETVAAIQRLGRPSRINVQIDPRPFDRFAIQQVPSFVLSTETDMPCTSTGCAATPATDSYIKTAGDVTLAYALEHMRRQAPEYGAELTRYLQRLEP